MKIPVQLELDSELVQSIERVASLFASSFKEMSALMLEAAVADTLPEVERVEANIARILRERNLPAQTPLREAFSEKELRELVKSVKP